MILRKFILYKHDIYVFNKKEYFKLLQLKFDKKMIEYFSVGIFLFLTDHEEKGNAARIKCQWSIGEIDVGDQRVLWGKQWCGLCNCIRGGTFKYTNHTSFQDFNSNAN